jgi:hypothetical protein
MLLLSSWVWVTVTALLVMAFCPTLTVVVWIYETLNLFSEISSK